MFKMKWAAILTLIFSFLAVSSCYTSKPLQTKRLKSYTFKASNEDRFESVKSAVASAIGGSLSFTTYSVLVGISSGFSPAWELRADTLAVSLLLFGITYRYAVREDENAQLKQGVVLSFAVSRALCLITPSEFCTSIPLDCGPPFHYFSISMILSGISGFIESLLGYGGAALALENLFEQGVVRRCNKLSKD